LFIDEQCVEFTNQQGQKYEPCRQRKKNDKKFLRRQSTISEVALLINFDLITEGGGNKGRANTTTGKKKK